MIQYILCTAYKWTSTMFNIMQFLYFLNIFYLCSVMHFIFYLYIFKELQDHKHESNRCKNQWSIYSPFMQSEIIHEWDPCHRHWCEDSTCPIFAFLHYLVSSSMQLYCQIRGEQWRVKEMKQSHTGDHLDLSMSLLPLTHTC